MGDRAPRERFGPGLIQVYTGDGKGKTTAAVGLGLRAAGHGFRVFLLQFMKGDPEYGELLALRRVPGFEFEQYGRRSFVKWREPDPEDLGPAAAGMERAGALLRAARHDLVILDEILCAVDYGLVPEVEVLALLDLKPAGMELVLTGRDAGPSILARADLVTEMREVRHPFTRGIPARKGIEF